MPRLLARQSMGANMHDELQQQELREYWSRRGCGASHEGGCALQQCIFPYCLPNDARSLFRLDEAKALPAGEQVVDGQPRYSECTRDAVRGTGCDRE